VLTGQGIKNFFRILENRKKRLRAFAQQLFYTNVLYKRFIHLFYTSVLYKRFIPQKQ
jgi:hypothetical protein